MAEMACDGPSPHSPSLRLGLPAPQPSRRHQTQSLLGPSFQMRTWCVLGSWHDPRTHHVLESHPEQAMPLSHRDDTPSALTPPLHCAFILQPAAPPQIVAFESWTISAPICLNHFTFAESRKSDLWTCVCVFTLFSSAFASMIEMNFSFKSLFANWSLSPQQFHYYFFLSIFSWQNQKYSTILILVLCLLCVTPLVCSSYSRFAPSSPFFSSWWQKKLWIVYKYTCSPMLSIDVVTSAPDDPCICW